MDRRTFLGGLGAFAAAGCIGKPEALTGATPVIPWQPRPTPHKVRVVMWGMCHEHAAGKFESLKKLPDDFELVGIVDDRASKTPRERQDFKRYKDVRLLTPAEVWADKSIGCVFVEVTNGDLPGIAWQVAKHGLAMHLDKPGGESLPRYAALLEFCKKRGIPLQMGYMFRVNPGIRFIRKAVRAGWLGDIISVEADMYHDYGSADYNAYIASFKGGLQYNLGCHLVDFMLDLLPGEPVKAHVVRQNAPGDPAGSGTSCVSILEWPTATATLRTARHAGGNKRWLRVQGTKGCIDLAPIERFDGKPLTLEMRLKEPAGTYAKGTHTIDCGTQNDRYAEQLRELAQIIRGERPNPNGYDHDIAVHKATLMACGLI